ncbi:MAG TPA: HAMP domain-containing sensor histidine kinase [Polyangiaceae bacterium]|nr:HAMP domain-containing sensor histidine kinase [Polyangiaceae bacterium]
MPRALEMANCWEVMGCGRQEGGPKAAELGVCPAAKLGPYSGVNGGKNGGRVCWAVAGTFCGGEVQGTFASKATTCMECKVFALVRREQGASFGLLPPAQTNHRALIEQFASITSIIDSINAVVYVADLHTHELLFVSQYTEKVFGEGMVGKPCWKALQANQAGPCAFCTNHRLVVDGLPGPPVVWEFQNTVTRRWFLCIDKAIPWWDGRLVRMEVAIDITDRKAADQFRDQYVGLISHDLRNPLNAVMIQAQVARRSLLAKGLTAESEAMDQVIASAKRMDVLIGDLLETTRLESGRLELRKLSVDLREWVARGVELVPMAKRDRIEVRSDSEPVMVSADAGRLDRVLENLLSNALKYSGEKAVTVAVRRHEGEAVVSVSDKGVGIAAADLPKLFERFYRAGTAGKVQGLGLGLYNARLIVEAHGGRIWADSEIGRGSEFHFALPLAAGRAVREGKPRQTATAEEAALGMVK